MKADECDGHRNSLSNTSRREHREPPVRRWPELRSDAQSWRWRIMPGQPIISAESVEPLDGSPRVLPALQPPARRPGREPGGSPQGGTSVASKGRVQLSIVPVDILGEADRAVLRHCRRGDGIASIGCVRSTRRGLRPFIAAKIRSRVHSGCSVSAHSASARRFSRRTHPLLKSRRVRLNDSCAGVSCIYTFSSFGQMNFTRPMTPAVRQDRMARPRRLLA